MKTDNGLKFTKEQVKLFQPGFRYIITSIRAGKQEVKMVPIDRPTKPFNETLKRLMMPIEERRLVNGISTFPTNIFFPQPNRKRKKRRKWK